MALSLFALNLALATDSTKAPGHGIDPVPCWCCIESPSGPHVIGTTAADCEHKHGHCYNTKPQADKACSMTSKKCWCCKLTTHEVSYIPTSECEKIGGHCFATKGEAYRACHPKK